MTVKETICKNCKSSEWEDSNYCPNCGTEDPWMEQSKYVMNTDDFPYVFSYRTYNDTYGLWEAFSSEYFGEYGINGRDVENIPDEFPRMKYCEVQLYFKITENYEMKGPFLSEKEARNA